MNDFREETRMSDKLTKIGKNSIIQHGKFNNRIYIMKLQKEDLDIVMREVEALTSKYNYTKIVAKTPEWAAPTLYSKGFQLEALIPGFYNNSTTAFFLSKFLDSQRKIIQSADLEDFGKILSDNTRLIKNSMPPKKYKIKTIKDDFIEDLADLYRQVFETYPFPIYNAEYILKTMKENIRYYGVFENNKIIAASSAEMDMEGKNVEMTDFAVLPEYRGNNLATHLLDVMEYDMKKNSFKIAYTIARLKSTGMNKTFLKNKYIYAGTLINNTNISGSIESMNVLYKSL